MKNINIVINELKLIENIDILFENKIVLYGAGFVGIDIHTKLKALGVSTIYFCDSNVQKWGKYINGTEIISFEKLQQLEFSEELAIIITTEQVQFIDQIADTLERLNIKTKNIFTALGLNISITQNINSSRIINSSNVAFFNMCANLDKLKGFSRNEYSKQWQTAQQIRIAEKWAKEEDVVLVYGIPKVGTSAMDKSLSAIGISTVKLHTLRKFLTAPNLSSPEPIGEFVKYRKLSHNNKIKIITGIREPVSMLISHLFQRIDKYGYMDIMLPGDSFMHSLVEKIKVRDKGLLILSNAFEQPDWFDEELKAVFGIDVYAHPFDRESGYSIIMRDNVEVLVIKLEKLNSLEKVIGEFVEAPHFKLLRENEAEQKPLKYLYRNVIDTIKLPREVFSFYYERNSRMNHFYSEEEKAAFWEKWHKNTEN